VAFAFGCIGWGQDLDSVRGEPVHLLVMPIPAVSKRDVELLSDAGVRELCSGGGDHRSEMPEVRRVAVDLSRDHHLLLGHDRLGVVTLHVPAERPHIPRVRIGQVDRPLRLRRGIWLWWTAEPPAVLHYPASAIGLIRLTRSMLDRQLFAQAPL